MSRFSRLALRCSPAVALLGLLAGCVPAPPHTADQASRQACRQRAEAVYVQQNRTSLYRTDSTDTPYGGATTSPGDSTTGLSALFGYDRLVDDCLRGSEANTELGAGGAAVAVPPTPARPADAEPLAGPAAGAPLSVPP